MQVHKSVNLLLLFLFSVCMAGCSTITKELIASHGGRVDLKKHTTPLNYNFFQSSSTTKEQRQLFYPEDTAFAQLALANDQIENDRETGPLPAIMAKNDLVRKIVQASYQSVKAPEVRSVEVTKKDLEGFNEMIARSFGAGASKNGDQRKDFNKFWEIVKKYLIVYYTDRENGFVDREGTKYKPPEIKDGIGNEVITATIAIFLEGLYDSLERVPVFVDKDGKYITKDCNEPTAARLKFARKETVVPEDEDKPGKITYNEVLAMRYLSGLVADHSKLISGAVFRLFGDLQVGAVFVAGHFAVGDNDTLARGLDTIIEVVFRRTVELAGYAGFQQTTEPQRGETPSPAQALLKDLSTIYPEATSQIRRCPQKKENIAPL